MWNNLDLNGDIETYNVFLYDNCLRFLHGEKLQQTALLLPLLYAGTARHGT